MTSASNRFGRFLVSGAVAAGVNYGARFAFSMWLPFAAAVTLAYLVGMVTAFLLMRRFVFEAHGRALVPQALKFTLVNLVSLAQTLAISLLIVRYTPATRLTTDEIEAIAHAVGLGVPIVTSYFGHKLATFR